MEILGIQLLGVLFGVGLIYASFINKKKNELNGPESAFWLIVGAALICSAVFPNMLNFLVKDILSISRTLDFLIIVSTMIILGVLFYVFLIT
jgi:hypothetical protein